MDIGLGVVFNLVRLVAKCILGSTGAGGELGIAVLGDALVSLLRSLSTSSLDGLRDVVNDVL